MIVKFTAGALVPGTLVAVSGAIGVTSTFLVGITGGYIGASFANKNLNPTKWDWESPSTYAGFFDGFTAATGTVNGIVQINTLVGTFSNELLKTAFLPATIAGAAAVGYYSASQANQGNLKFWEWEWNEESMASTFGEMMFGFGTVIALSSTVGGLKNLHTDKYVGTTLINKLEKTKKFIRSLPGPMGETIAEIVQTALTTAENDHIQNLFDIDNYKVVELGTYESIANGFFEGKAPYTELIQLHKATVQVSQQIFTGVAKGLLNLNRKKREVKWSLRLIFDPKLIGHYVVPQVTKAAPIMLESSYNRSDEIEKPTLQNEISANYNTIILNQITSDSYIPLAATFEEFSNNSTFNVLQMGDDFLRNVDTIGNLTLLNLFVDKLFNSNKPSKQINRFAQRSDIEYRLKTSEVVNGFVENFLECAENLGLSNYFINHILENSIELASLNIKVERELRRKNATKINQILSEAVAESLTELKPHLSKENYDELRSCLTKDILTIEDKLLEFFNNA